ncbi:transcription factor bHLH36-like [Andrographis paniculata]|uniref:transcription factor bHLH36-like n=1 Tax=Andrographis paniculata TaxID=175694 RepID=UPI0021E853A1|nr:transcription factor bHLH36-like [Andrographis paniculata]
MFSLQARDELVFGNPNYINNNNNNNYNYNISPHPHPQPAADKILLLPDPAIQIAHGGGGGGGGAGGGAPARKKDVLSGQSRVLHREIERRRRQDMSNLHAKLRGLLPIEFIKGKRSICDHMQEAVNYIKNIKSNIDELRIRRDKLRKSCDHLSRKEILIGETSSNNIGNNIISPNFVMVSLAGEGLEILISCRYINTDFRLSKMLAQLLEKNISVVSCVSTNTKGRFLHKIHAEVSDVSRIDLLVLQERLQESIDLN